MVNDWFSSLWTERTVWEEHPEGGRHTTYAALGLCHSLKPNPPSLIISPLINIIANPPIIAKGNEQGSEEEAIFLSSADTKEAIFETVQTPSLFLLSYHPLSLRRQSGKLFLRPPISSGSQNVQGAILLGSLGEEVPAPWHCPSPSSATRCC
jgi:hypothetical protein